MTSRRRYRAAERGIGRVPAGILAVLAAVLAPFAAGAAGEGWRETARADGIVVSERPTPGQDVPMFRGIGVVAGELATVLAVIEDVARYPEWLPDCAEARLLARPSARVSYVYHRTDVPWPVADRDVVLRQEVRAEEAGRVMHVTIASDASVFMPPAAGAVRVVRLLAGYRLEALGGARTRVEYRVDVDPGGALPAWFAARMTRLLPLHTIAGLRAQIARVRATGARTVTARNDAGAR